MAPGTVLRVSGARAKVVRFLGVTAWKPLTIYWAGEARFAGSKRISKANGFNVAVSSVAAAHFAGQLRDSTRFFRKHGQEFRRLKRMNLSAVLDFGIEVQDGSVPTFVRFPFTFVSTLARYGVELEVSYYGGPVA